MEIGAAIFAVLATIMMVVVFVATRQHPENAADHGPDRDGDRDSSTELFGSPHDRPAGPGAEADGVAGRGAPAPGPSAEALGDRAD